MSIESIEKITNILSGKFTVNYLEPFGVELTASNNQDLDQIDPDIIHKLMKNHRIVLFRNLPAISKEKLVRSAEKLGPLLSWDFGNVMEMRVHEQPKNYLFTNGPVPFHWDGAFYKEPRYLLFHCIEAPLADCGGETLFTDTHSIWLKAKDATKQEWQDRKLKYKTEKLAHYGGEIEISLVQNHPYNNEEILRFAEAVPKTMLNPVEVSIEGMDTEMTEKWLSEMSAICYQTENCYAHQWQNNDVLLADNFSLIHARRAFKNFSPRFLRRIQIL